MQLDFLFLHWISRLSPRNWFLCHRQQLLLGSQSYCWWLQKRIECNHTNAVLGLCSRLTFIKFIIHHKEPHKFSQDVHHGTVLSIMKKQEVFLIFLIPASCTQVAELNTNFSNWVSTNVQVFGFSCWINSFHCRRHITVCPSVGTKNHYLSSLQLLIKVRRWLRDIFAVPTTIVAVAYLLHTRPEFSYKQCS